MILTPKGGSHQQPRRAGSSTVTVTLFGQTSAMAAHVIGTDPSLDLALVQIDGGHDLPTVDLGNSNAPRSATASWPSATRWRSPGPDGDKRHRVGSRPLAFGRE